MLSPLPASRWNYRTAAHLLSRAGFGGTPAAVEELVKLGPDQAVDRFLDYEAMRDPIPNPDWAKPDPNRGEMFLLARNMSEPERREFQQREQRTQRERLVELQNWWLKRMAEGTRPLEEKLTLFWHGHFATSFQKAQDAYLMWQQNDTFRRNASGNWLKLLVDVAQDPAMLIWLDQAQSNRRNPNENFARELMELFALGEGHYTEQDVIEAARALTGFTLDRVRRLFQYNPDFHAEGDKSILGRTGDFDGWHVLRVIAEQPQTDRFITGKLWQFFAEEPPAEELQAALAREFHAGKQNFKPLLRRLLRAEEFYADSVIGRQVKSPVVWLVGTVRLLERPLPPPLVCSSALRLLGQDLFLPPNVKGWDGGLSWITTNSLLNRYNFTEFLVLGTPPNLGGSRGGDGPMMLERMAQAQVRRSPSAAPVKVEKLFTPEERNDRAALLAALQRRFLLAPLTAKQVKVLNEYLDSKGSLDDTAVLHTIRLLMCTPEFQLA